VAKRRVRIRWSGPARADLIAAYGYLRAANPAAAGRYAAQVRKSVGRLRQFPRSGAKLWDVPLEGEFRSIVVRNHRVIYRVNDREVLIFRVWDCGQDPVGMWDVEPS
jgi:plasmid stabilization system protein ParE